MMWWPSHEPFTQASLTQPNPSAQSSGELHAVLQTVSPQRYGAQTISSPGSTEGQCPAPSHPVSKVALPSAHPAGRQISLAPANPAHESRSTPSHARDAQTSGDPIAAENYYQHAEHYYRVIAAAQEQFRQNNPQFARADTDSGPREASFEEGEEDASQGGNDAPYGTREPQPYLPRDSQPYQHNQPQFSPHPVPGGSASEGDVERLPSFITGGGQQGAHQPPQQGPNGHDGRSDRFPLHRRRRRHRGPRHDMQGGGRPDEGGQGPEDR
jgi:hypothetical protein